MSGTRRLSTGQPRSPVWDFRWNDTRRTPDDSAENMERCKRRILELRSILWATREGVSEFGKGTTSAARRDKITTIVKRIDDTLGQIEWEIVD